MICNGCMGKPWNRLDSHQHSEDRRTTVSHSPARYSHLCLNVRTRFSHVGDVRRRIPYMISHGAEVESTPFFQAITWNLLEEKTLQKIQMQAAPIEKED
jgi:hypothetical protein